MSITRAFADPREDHHRVIRISLDRLLTGEDHTILAEGLDADVKSVSNGIHSALGETGDRVIRRRIVDMATL